MNIIVVATTPFYFERGSHLRILNETISLKKAGHIVDILTYPMGTNPKEFTASGIKITRIPNIFPWYKKTSPGPSFWKVFLDVAVFMKLLFMVMTQEVDIIYAHNHEAVVVAYLAQKIFFWKNIKTVGDFQGNLVFEMITYKNIKSSIIKKFLGFVEGIIYKMPNQSVASSRPLAEYISKFRINKCEVFYDAPSIPFILHDKKKMREKYLIPQEACVILYAGGFTQDKGMNSLFDLISMCHSSIDNSTRTWVVAGGPIESLKIPEDIKSNIKIISPLNLETLTELLSLADFAIDPKIRTTFQASGKVINYMQYGLPVFCFDDTISRDYLGNVLADKFTGNDIESLRNKILFYTKDMRENSKISAELQTRAKCFLWDDIIKML